MLRLTHGLLLFVAITTFVAAGPTVRKDEVANVITTAAEIETSEKEPAAPIVEPPSPVNLPISNDDVPSNVSTSTVASQTKPSAAPTTSPPTTPVSSSTGTTTVAGSSTTTKSPSTTASSSVVQTSTPFPITFTKPSRKVITFDQRQEGKYNIRADLENFVIVVVPSGSSSGASLLDLLTRSAQRKDAHHQTRGKQAHKRKNHKAHGAHKKVPQVTPEVIVLDETNQRSGALEAEEFIEGRTPYKVDLSSSARSVDGPTTDRKPSFTFSVEPSASSRLIRFPAASGNYPPLATAGGAATRHTAALENGGYGRALRFAGYANTNPLLVATGSSSATNNNILPNGDGDQQRPPPPGRPTSFPLALRRSSNDAAAQEPVADASDDGANELFVVTATVHRPTRDHSHHPSSFDSLGYEPLLADVDMTQLRLQPDEDAQRNDTDHGPNDDLDGWDELRLLGAQEQCGPDRKRDSYGVCQFVQP